jgi:hypothetical protein
VPARLVFLVTSLLVATTAARADDAWERLRTTDAAVVDVRRGDVPRVRTTGELPFPAEAVAAVLGDLEHFPSWFPRLQSWEVVRSPEGLFAYGRHDLSWPLDPRDYYVRYTLGRDGDAFTLSAASAPGRPLVKGRVRLTDVASSWRVEPRGPSRCRVVYVYDVPAPGVPDALLEGAWKSEGPAVLRALAAEVRRRGPGPAATNHDAGTVVSSPP